jgi:hypothetical protein
MNFTNQSAVTVVLTSCNRPSLLAITLESFFKFNTYPLHSFIIVEDSGVKDCNKALEKQYPFIKWINNSQNKGQAESIDIGYRLVNTKYIFHMEEDWQFYKSGFIEDSIKVLERSRHILQVWIRYINDTNGHPIEKSIQSASGVKFKYVTTGYNGKWHGFSFNPSLKRLSDYKLIGSYAKHSSNREKGATVEANLSKLYFEMGYFAAIINGKGYVKHIGDNAHIARNIKEQPQEACFIIPYRDRETHINKFIPHLIQYLKYKQFQNYTIKVIEQADNKPFNRAKLLNIGAVLSEDSDYFIFHDVDMLPKEADYRYSQNPTHIATQCSQFGYRMPYPAYFGGVNIFDKHLFNKINGYSNEFWGWGGEDDELLIRCRNLFIERRQCRFESLPHSRDLSNHQQVVERLQMAKENNYLSSEDGLNTLEYNLISRTQRKYYELIKVQL